MSSALQLSLAEMDKPQQNRVQAPYGFLEFFAGSGLVAEGLRGIFAPLWANDICPKKARVYTANHGYDHFVLGPIQEIHGQDLPHGDLSWASFPCQDLSLAGNTEGIHASRSGLVWEWLRIIDESPRKPELLVAENVTGLVTSEKGKNYFVLHQALVERGYRVGAVVMDAVHWLPQSRPRVFVIAVSRNLTIPPSLLSDGPTWLHPNAVTHIANQLAGQWLWWRMPAPPPRQQSLADILEWDAPCLDQGKAKKLVDIISPLHKQRLEQLGATGTVVAAGYKRTRHGNQVLELRFDGNAGCLRTPEGGSSRQYLVIYSQGRYQCRLLTVRETARLMGAPEPYTLPGTYNDGYKAMGDAVAVPVARYLATHLLSPLLEANHGRIVPAAQRV